MTPGTGGGGRFTGRMHAAPTNRPGTAGRRAKQAFAADRHGGVKTPPYKPAGTGNFPANPARGTGPAAPIYALGVSTALPPM